MKVFLFGVITSLFVLNSFGQSNTAAFERDIDLSIASSQNNIAPKITLEYVSLDVTKLPFLIAPHSYIAYTTESHFIPAPVPIVVKVPEYTQGKFCDFEDRINRNRKLRIDFSLR